MSEEEADEWWRVEVMESRAEGGERADGMEEVAAGEGGVDEGREGGEADEDLEEEVVADGEYGAGNGLRGFRRRRRRQLEAMTRVRLVEFRCGGMPHLDGNFCSI